MDNIPYFEVLLLIFFYDKEDFNILIHCCSMKNFTQIVRHFSVIQNEICIFFLNTLICKYHFSYKTSTLKSNLEQVMFIQ